MRQISLPIKIGILLGFLFFAHAMVPDSNAWPLIWPVAAGAMAVFLAARSGRLRTFWQGAGAAVKAGAVAGAFFFAATAAALWLLSTASFEPLARTLGADGPIAVNTNVLLSLALTAIIATAVAAISGAAMYPLARRKGV